MLEGQIGMNISPYCPMAHVLKRKMNIRYENCLGICQSVFKPKNYDVLIKPGVMASED